MTLTDREKALVDAARSLMTPNGVTADRYECLKAALRAYDPPKPKVPVLPDWLDLTDEQRVGILEKWPEYGSIQSFWDNLRELTAKDSE